jgi:uncharacterized OsmC-like protein
MSNQASQIREKVEFLSKVFAETPDAARVQVPAATAVLDGGLAFHMATPNGGIVSSDMPSALGGGEKAPTPGWLLNAAVASCAATVIAMRAASLGVKLSKLEVACTAEADVRGMLGVGTDAAVAFSRLALRVSIASDSTRDEDLREIVRWASAHSPLMDTIRNPVSLDIPIVPIA